MTFQQLEISSSILKAIDDQGYETPSPIQTSALPVIFAGHDLLASAQTGTGKTAAFAIPLIQMIAISKIQDKEQKIRALILAPTRELAEQIKDAFNSYSSYANIHTGAIYGGASQRGQEKMLKKGIDILVATPGRLKDLLKQHVVSLRDVHYFVLDEADTMLDMGFINDVKHIKGFIPKERQTLMFSATISPAVSTLARDLLIDPKTLMMSAPDKMIDKIHHSVFFVEKKEKVNLLLDLLTDNKLTSILVFTRTKHGANNLVKDLLSYGVKTDAIHGNKSQKARQIALNDFKSGKNRVLVATDIAARGIDIDNLSHVINFDLPESAETYVHRIGRTGRRGLSGEAYTFCGGAEKSLLRAVEKHTGLKMIVLTLGPVNADSKFKKVVISQEKEEKREPTRNSKRNYSSNRSNNDERKTNFQRSTHFKESPDHELRKYKSKRTPKFDKSPSEEISSAPRNFAKKKRSYQTSSEGFNSEPRSYNRTKRAYQSSTEEANYAPRAYSKKKRADQATGGEFSSAPRTYTKKKRFYQSKYRD